MTSGLRLTILVVAELPAAGALVVAGRQVAVTVFVAVVLSTLVRPRGLHAGTWLALRCRYVLRRRRMRATPAVHDGVEQVAGAPELALFFPGMAVREAQLRDGARLGVVQWHGTFSATLRIRAPTGIVLARGRSDNVPIEAIIAAVDGQDLGLDSVQILTQTVSGAGTSSLAPLLAVARAELNGERAQVRNRTTFVTVRLDPGSAAVAIAVRGGGNTGDVRVLSTALNRIQAALDELGLASEVLDRVEAVRSIAEGLYHQATRYDPIVRWTESVRHLASPRMLHRSFVVTDVGRGALADLTVDDVFAHAVGVQARPQPDGDWSNRAVLRLTCRTLDSLDRAADAADAAARRLGITLRPLDVVQHLGIRATVPIGGC